jgi:hypothetical protein
MKSPRVPPSRLLAELAAFWLRGPSLLDGCALRRVGEATFEVRWSGRLHPITFDRGIAEASGSGALLFTYGHPVFDGLLAQGGGSDHALAALGVRRSVVPGGAIA